MPYRIEFDRANQIFRSTFSGNTSDDEFRAYFIDARKCLSKVQPAVSIVDLSQVAGSGVSTHVIAEKARGKPIISDPMVPVYIIAPADHVFGASRMYQLMAGNTRPRLHVVRSAEEVYCN
ncbi:MAG TPA: hypothetical protein VLK33_03905 [Terriglobales bacterium]|nr:hypothetical protein [Terriglobales bacterium]